MEIILFFEIVLETEWLAVMDFSNLVDANLLLLELPESMLTVQKGLFLISYKKN